MAGEKYVYDFAEGHRELKELLGGKGANLAEMTRLGLPVPAGFTVTTEACRGDLRTGSVARGPAEQSRAPRRPRGPAPRATRSPRCCSRPAPEPGSRCPA